VLAVEALLGLDGGGVDPEQAAAGDAQVPVQARLGGDDPAQLGPPGPGELVAAGDHLLELGEHPRPHGGVPLGRLGAAADHEPLVLGDPDFLDPQVLRDILVAALPGQRRVRLGGAGAQLLADDTASVGESQALPVRLSPCRALSTSKTRIRPHRPTLTALKVSPYRKKYYGIAFSCGAAGPPITQCSGGGVTAVRSLRTRRRRSSPRPCGLAGRPRSGSGKSRRERATSPSLGRPVAVLPTSVRPRAREVSQQGVRSDSPEPESCLRGSARTAMLCGGLLPELRRKPGSRTQCRARHGEGAGPLPVAMVSTSQRTFVLAANVSSGWDCGDSG
jgi:hypothetical protein